MTITYAIVDTGQTTAYGNLNALSGLPAAGADFYGQDATYSGNQPSYRDNGDGTVTDLVTGLMWQKAPAANVSYSAAQTGAASASTGGYSDWRLPTIKELYSLIRFDGYTGETAATSKPYIDTVFSFSYGDESVERFIDAQYWSSTQYVGTTMTGNATAFGVNFADGRIKGYPTANKLGEVLYVRGNTDYGVNRFTDNGDGTVTDAATGLMWVKADSGTAMTWQNALAYAEGLTTAGHTDWRLPNVKELHSLTDYSRAPAPTNATAANTGPAIDPVFSLTNIGTAGSPDYPYVWSGTTHVEGGVGRNASYVSFGQAWGWMSSTPGGTPTLMDVHGAGAQRSDPKSGNASDYPTGFGPQGDVIRIDNYVLAVRDAGTTSSGGGSGGSTGGETFTVNGTAQTPGAASATSAALGMTYETVLGSGADVARGTSANDFINGAAGDDAIDCGAGNDIADGGLGSNFLTGGAGTDIFFVDGRGASGAGGVSVWSTVTDFTKGSEQVTLWGWQPGVSRIVLQDGAGAAGYTGATVHAYLDADGVADASLTLTGLSTAALSTTAGTVGGNDYLLIA